jgi:hypothetical protein
MCLVEDVGLVVAKLLRYHRPAMLAGKGDHTPSAAAACQSCQPLARWEKHLPSLADD